MIHPHHTNVQLAQVIQSAIIIASMGHTNFTGVFGEEMGWVCGAIQPNMVSRVFLVLAQSEK